MYEQYFSIQKFTLKVFLGINTDKGIGAPLAGPKPVPIPINFFALAGHSSIGLGVSGSTIFQNEESWLAVQLLIWICKTPVISMEMQIPDINNWRHEVQKLDNHEVHP